MFAYGKMLGLLGLPILCVLSALPFKSGFPCGLCVLLRQIQSDPVAIRSAPFLRPAFSTFHGLYLPRHASIIELEYEVSNPAGTICALSGGVINFDRLGGESISHGASAVHARLAAKIMNTQLLDFEEAIRKIIAVDGRYQAEAYRFVQEAIRYTQKALGRTKTGHQHVGGKELLNGIRDHALATFGPMTPTVLAEWGVHSCEDFGEIVFNLIQFDQAKKSQSDSREDFKGGYDFDEAFRKPFLPSKPRAMEPKSSHSKAVGKG
jgi:uncharacterized repeat protein (TIGR04138 family)